MRGLFITGTGTGVGKTVVTGCLARYFQKKGKTVVTQKWIQTGISSDIRTHLKLMQKKESEFKSSLSLMAPYKFKTACAPHLASRIEKKLIRKGKIVKSFKVLSSRFDIVLVEGTGGVLVPCSPKEILIDIARTLKLPVLVIAQNQLGAVNHTLLTLEALKKRGLCVLGVVFNNIRREKKLILDDNPDIVKKISGCEVFGVLRHARTQSSLYKDFSPIADNIWRCFVGLD